jgi:hypothetical protein
MKKTLLSLLLISAGISAQAQTLVKIENTCPAPIQVYYSISSELKGGFVIRSGDSYEFNAPHTSSIGNISLFTHVLNNDNLGIYSPIYLNNTMSNVLTYQNNYVYPIKFQTCKLVSSYDPTSKLYASMYDISATTVKEAILPHPGKDNQ